MKTLGSCACERGHKRANPHAGVRWSTHPCDDLLYVLLTTSGLQRVCRWKLNYSRSGTCGRNTFARGDRRKQGDRETA